MSATTPVTEHQQHNRTFFGHPPMLASLFTVEMWERFSFYGMQALAIYYLYYSIDKGGLGIPEEAATGAMGAYGATVYLMAILGGILGDRVLGPNVPSSIQRLVLWRAILPSPPYPGQLAYS